MTNFKEDAQLIRASRRRRSKVIASTLGLSLGALMALQSGSVGTLSFLAMEEAFFGLIESAGALTVILLMAAAIVVSPIPSGPIAMAAGATLGPLLGGAATGAGAVLGALIAFSLSRRLGYRPLSASKVPIAGWITRPRSQKSLAIAVLLSRLIPFISFDAISYLAGLTTIRMRYFAVATTLGVLPASFAFAALGAGMAELDDVMLMMMACGVTLILPAGWVLHSTWQKRRSQFSGSKT